jgi:CRP-like cAMP-binding protein/CheY-like chemotaxis protein
LLIVGVHLLSSNVQELQSIPVFNTFPKDLLIELAKFMVPMAFKKGERLMNQGQTNNSIYFLNNGRLGIYVDGGLVAHIDKTGDIFGEMAVISGQPASATILAETNIECWRLDVIKFDNIPEFKTDLFQHLVYRIYSWALTDKLKITNQKAKHFEKLTNELKEAQYNLTQINKDLELRVKDRTRELENKTIDLLNVNQHLEHRQAELLAGHKKLEVLYSAKEYTFSKLKNLQKNYLEPLGEQLGSLSNASEDYMRKSLEHVHQQLLQVQAEIDPITRQYSTEQAIKEKRVLLADSNKKQQIFTKMALGGTGVHLQIASTSDEVIGFIENELFDIIFLDVEMFDICSKLREVTPSSDIVLMTSPILGTFMQKVREFGFIPNIVSRDENDRTFTIKNIITTVTKLSTQDIFGLERYLSWGVDLIQSSVCKSSERSTLIEQVNKYFEGIGIRKTVRNRCDAVLEELLMNAIYDAPTNNEGKSLFNHLPRTQPVELQPEQYGQLRYATDGVLVGISVTDPFGSLDGKIILDYLNSCYSGQAGELNKQKGGAGRGLHQIIENSDLVVFNISPKIRTEVIALFQVDVKSNPDKIPSFHLFIK